MLVVPAALGLAVAVAATLIGPLDTAIDGRCRLWAGVVA